MSNQLLSIIDQYCAMHTITLNVTNQYACFWGKKIFIAS